MYFTSGLFWISKSPSRSFPWMVSSDSLLPIHGLQGSFRMLNTVVFSSLSLTLGVMLEFSRHSLLENCWFTKPFFSTYIDLPDRLELTFLDTFTPGSNLLNLFLSSSKFFFKSCRIVLNLPLWSSNKRTKIFFIQLHHILFWNSWGWKRYQSTFSI